MFKKAGFDDVRLAQDFNVAGLRKALRGFADAAATADIAVVFYAGHGVEIGGKNYLVPVDARLLTDIDVDDEAIDLDYVLARLEGAKRLKLVILDACRENPFRTKAKTRSVGRGLRAPDAAVSDTLIAFAAQPGDRRGVGRLSRAVRLWAIGGRRSRGAGQVEPPPGRGGDACRSAVGDERSLRRRDAGVAIDACAGAAVAQRGMRAAGEGRF